MVNRLFDKIFKKLSLVLLKFFRFLSKLVWSVLLNLFALFYNNIGGLFKSLSRLFGPSKPLLYNYLVNSINFFLFIFITIPWWFCGEYVKPVVITCRQYVSKVFNYYPVVQININLFKLTFLNAISAAILILNKLYIRGWKNFIDFAFFKVFRNRILIYEQFKIYVYIFIKIYILYILFYKNYWNTFYNFILHENTEYIISWDISSITGILFVFFTFLNVDNILILIHIFVTEYNLIFFNQLDYCTMFLSVGFAWTETYFTHRASFSEITFCSLLVDSLLNNIVYSGVLFYLDLDSIPVFFFFGVLFFMTVALSWFFFSYLGLYGIFTLNIVTLFLFWLSLLYYIKEIFVLQKVFTIKMSNWVFLSTNVKIDYYFYIDVISFSFMLLTTTIAFFVFIYAFSYFRYEPLVDRFLLFILSFVISMIFLVTSGNTIMLFLGWELIGFTSFCLINFWTTKTATLKSAFKAFTFNKISDFFMFMFLITSYCMFYTFDIQTLNSQVCTYKFYNIYIFGTQVSSLEFLACMIIGASFIKSAQLGGHAWLPDSMEAPVPASSLIHSATLVSAGIYMILRFNFIFDATQFSKFIIPIMGSLTAAYGGVCAIAQSDIKKTLAYSTISHCGFLMVLCSTEMNEFTIIYLYVHGFFKAGVFMCVGNVLRISRGYQDTRRMGGLVKYLPFEYFCAVIGVLNLAGLPFTFGFFIKHILLTSLGGHIYIYYFVMFNSLIGAFSGLFYSYRLITYTFIDFKKANKALYINLNRTNYNSNYYTNSSIGGTLSIFFLFITAYIVIYYLLISFLFSNFLFSDCMNTTILSNYYALISSHSGYLLNFSYINITVVIIVITLVFSRFRKTQHIQNLYKYLISLSLGLVFFFLFYSLL